MPKGLEDDRPHQGTAPGKRAFSSLAFEHGESSGGEVKRLETEEDYDNFVSA